LEKEEHLMNEGSPSMLSEMAKYTLYGVLTVAGVMAVTHARGWKGAAEVVYGALLAGADSVDSLSSVDTTRELMTFFAPAIAATAVMAAIRLARMNRQVGP
jgi:hypothetical protein